MKSGQGCVGREQLGFTLVEAAIVLVIMTFLIGGMLKGWQMVQSSRVRTLASTVSSVQSAYFAFYDRFGHVAGDWNAVEAGNAIGSTLNGGGNDNGRLDTTPGSPWRESNAFWEHLAQAGFLNGTYQGTDAEPTLENNRTPLNVYHRPMVIGRTSDYEGAIVARRHIIVGRGVPAKMLRELDTKLDDGKADQGRVRATVDDAAVTVFGGVNFWGGRDAACVNAAQEWDVDAASPDCNGLLLF